MSPTLAQSNTFPGIATPPTIAMALRSNARIIFNLSGGKDSSAALLAVMSYLDRIGHPRSLRSAIHADLGDIEWPMTTGFVRSITTILDLPLTIVKRSAGGLIERWADRFARAKQRYINLETYALIGPWSSASLRFCTSETKAAPIASHTSRHHRGETVIHVIGIRREESSARASSPDWKRDPKSSNTTQIYHWHPIIDWLEADVFAAHDSAGLPLHPAYRQHQSSRMGCSYCILATKSDHCAAARSGHNTQSLTRLVTLELQSTFSFQPNRWLYDLAPDLLPEHLHLLAAARRQMSDQRRSLEAALPPDLRYQKGWPPRIPDHSEAIIISDVRREILAHHGLASPFITPASIIDRFAQLHRGRKLAC